MDDKAGCRLILRDLLGDRKERFSTGALKFSQFESEHWGQFQQKRHERIKKNCACRMHVEIGPGLLESVSLSTPSPYSTWIDRMGH